MSHVTDQQISQHVIPAACRLICAVHDRDPDEVAHTLRDVQTALHADPTTAARALAVVLAAACPVDRPITELLAVGEEYARLVQLGITHDHAALVAGAAVAARTTTREAG